MKKTGIIDIGSNTIVLAVYETNRGSLRQTEIVSSSLRLLNYLHDGIMEEEGISRARDLLKQYRLLLKEKNITESWAYITEPCRQAENRDHMLEELQTSGFVIESISAQEEALLAYQGSRLDCGGIRSGTAFDIGGGSTQLIRFQNGEVMDAVCIDEGCLNLKEASNPRAAARKLLEDALQNHPAFFQDDSTPLIGMGGSVRAALKLAEKMEVVEKELSLDAVKKMLLSIDAKNPDFLVMADQTIEEDRKDLFVPGLSLIEAVLDVLHAECVHVSSSCVREGYLMKKLWNS